VIDDRDGHRVANRQVHRLTDQFHAEGVTGTEERDTGHRRTVGENLDVVPVDVASVRRPDVAAGDDDAVTAAEQEAATIVVGQAAVEDAAVRASTNPFASPTNRSPGTGCAKVRRGAPRCRLSRPPSRCRPREAARRRRPPST